MKNLNFDEVIALAAKNPKAALRLHFEGEDSEATEYYAKDIIPAMEVEAARMVDDGGYGVSTVEEAMNYLNKITYICSEEDYQEEQSEQDRDE
jgi:hypothetical protein